MSRLSEIFAFSGLAVGAHLAAWVWVGGDGVESAGSGGDAAISLAAASGEVSDLIATWTAPPELLDTAMDALPQITDPDSTPAPQLATATAPRSALPALPNPEPLDLAPIAPEPPPLPDPQTIAQPAPPDQPAPVVVQELDTASADPLPEAPAPQTSLRPVQRPTELVKSQPTKRKAKTQPTAKPKTSKPANQSTAQKAIGTAQGATAGTKKNTNVATLSQAARQSLISKWGASIRNGVERRKRYPNGTRASGTAIVRLSISPQGRLLSAKLAKSSGDAKLDRAAVEAVQRARIPKAPKGLTSASYSFNLPIAFQKR